jgi:ABC-type histidine transport system ATPase subunit
VRTIFTEKVFTALNQRNLIQSCRRGIYLHLLSRRENTAAKRARKFLKAVGISETFAMLPAHFSYRSIFTDFATASI